MPKQQRAPANDAITELLTRGVAEVIEREHLEERLRRGDKLRVKFGIDPTAPDLHLGHLVPLRKLREFQDLGHTVVLIIGDYTATIGDPSGKDETRQQLSSDVVRANMTSYLDQARIVLDVDHAEIRYNSEWFERMTALDIAQLTSKVTVQRVLERDDFKKRIAEDRDVSMLEAFYPLFQGYDSVMVRADVEIGGTDQKFNFLMGRKIQRRYDQQPQDVLTVPLLEGLDGTKKMGKSAQNYVGLREPEDGMYAKLMTIPDTLMRKYFDLVTNCSAADIDEAMRAENPRDAKMRLAREVVQRIHGAKAAEHAQAAFASLFQKHEVPEDVATKLLQQLRLRTPVPLTTILVRVGFASSSSDARRLIKQGGVKIDGQPFRVADAIFNFKDYPNGILIQKGKRHFIRVIA